MSFFKKSLQALGFGNEPEDKSQVYTAKNITDMTGKDRSQPNKTSQPTATTAKPQVTKPQATEPVAEAQPVTNNTPDNDNNNNNTSVVPDILLDKVVELVNASLPDFVRNCIDTEVEKKYIYEQLGDSFKTYVNNLNTSARQQSEANINSTRKQLENEMSSLRRKTTELEEQKADLKNQQLSTERQKRALNERIHDLEGRITTLEAEKEQYELENKSLINRLKVSGIKQQEVDDAQEEITRLLGVIQEIKQNGTVPAEVQEELSAKDTAIETLKAELAQLTEQQAPLSAITDELNAQNEMLKTQVDELNKLYNEAQGTIANLNNDNTQLNTSIADHTAQVAELKSTIETLSQENNKLQATSASLEQDNLSHNEQVTTLTLKIETLTAEKETLTAEKEALNAEKEALNAEVAAKDNNIALLNTELESAKNQQISDNLKLNTLQANEQEIITLKASLDKSNNRCNELESAIEKLRLSEQQANKTLNDNQAKIDQCNSTIDELNNQIDELNKALEILEKVEAKVAQYEKLEQQKNAINNDNKELKKRIEQLEGELINAKKETARLASQPAQSSDSSEELEKANNMIAALKKQRQELVSQTATLRSQNKAYENQIASLESKLSNDSHSTISFEGIATDIDEAINWMMPVLPDSLEEEARRKEEEERQRREEEERERQAEKERRALRDDSSSQMSLW